MTLADQNDVEIDTAFLESRVRSAVASIDDPEYPGISIVDLGLLEQVTVGADRIARVGLIPTFAGCPQLAVIANDVAEAVSAVNGVERCDVEWLESPAWHADRVSHEARSCLERKFTVAVQLGERSTTCPLCASKTVEQSTQGQSACRSVHSCTGCGETVEVMRG